MTTAGVIVFVLRRSEAGCEVLFLRRSGGAFGSQWWPVGGTCRSGEAAIDTTVRELGEETGLSSAEFYDFGWTIAHADGRSRIDGFVTFVDASDRVMLNYEHSEYRWLSAEAAAKVVLDPRPIEHLRDNFMRAAPSASKLAFDSRA